MAEAVLLRFSQEELVYLLRALKIPTLTGLGSQPLGDLDEEHQGLALAVADRALRARGVVRWNTNQERSLDPLVAGLLRDCAGPDYSLAVEIRQKEQPTQQYRYVFTRHVVIEQSLPEPGVHQFMALATRADVLARLDTLVHYPPGITAGGQPGQIPIRRLLEVQAVAPANPNEARRILGAGLPIETARILASLLSAPNIVQYLALWKGAPDQPAKHPPIASLTILQSQQYLFCLKQPAEETAPVEVIPGTAAQVPVQIEHLLTPALEALEAASGA
jgi:hypothetical protein